MEFCLPDFRDDAARLLFRHVIMPHSGRRQARFLNAIQTDHCDPLPLVRFRKNDVAAKQLSGYWRWKIAMEAKEARFEVLPALPAVETGVLRFILGRENQRDIEIRAEICRRQHFVE